MCENKVIALKVGEKYGRPSIYYSYPKVPSWKTSGEGRAIIQLTIEPDGSLELEIQELGETGRGKQVFANLPSELAVKLAEMIKNSQPKLKC